MTMYELLGMVKDDKAPKKIIAGDSETEYYFDKELKDYISTRNQEKLFEEEIGKFLKYYINDEVEIIEEEKKIEHIDLSERIGETCCISPQAEKIQNTINKIIDKLNKE